MLKRLLNKAKQWFAVRELNRQIANEELSTSRHIVTVSEQEAHETYKLGDFTASVMGSGEELKRKILLTKLERVMGHVDLVNKATDTAFNNLVPVVSMLTGKPVIDPKFPKSLMKFKDE